MRGYQRLKELLPAVVFMTLLAALSIGAAISTWRAFPHGLV